jgi:pyruvate dehydrogenase kinase 2/3/4
MIPPGSKSLFDRIDYLSQYKQRPVTLGQLYEFGQHSEREAALLAQARFLHHELPVRLSHRVQELGSLPFGLSEMPSVRRMRDMYADSIRELTDCPRPDDTRGEKAFTELIAGIKYRHRDVVPTIARGILELKRGRGPDAVNEELQAFLDRLYISRIGCRMLIGHHIALHGTARAGHVGLICEKCSPAEVARQAILDARLICRLHYGVAPAVGLLGNLDLCFTYIPSHLHHMLIEILKNAMRAVVEFHGPGGDLPMVRVAIAGGAEDVTIKIADEGGGIARSGISRIWTYLYSTAPPPDLDSWDPSSTDFVPPYAGLGYGLPLSRLYARYFGGDLHILSMEGYGTDAFFHLRRLANAEEVIPRKLCLS